MVVLVTDGVADEKLGGAVGSGEWAGGNEQGAREVVEDGCAAERGEVGDVWVVAVEGEACMGRGEGVRCQDDGRAVVFPGHAQPDEEGWSVGGGEL